MSRRKKLNWGIVCARISFFFFFFFFCWMKKIAADGSNTTSVMKLTPTFRDHETELICSAANPQLLLTTSAANASAASIEIKKKLNVHCKPSPFFSPYFNFPLLLLANFCVFSPFPSLSTLTILSTSWNRREYNEIGRYGTVRHSTARYQIEPLDLWNLFSSFLFFFFVFVFLLDDSIAFRLVLTNKTQYTQTRRRRRRRGKSIFILGKMTRVEDRGGRDESFPLHQYIHCVRLERK